MLELVDIEISDDIEEIRIVNKITLEQYIENLAHQQIQLTMEINQRKNEIKQLEDSLGVVMEKYKDLLLNRKTIIKKKLKDNPGLTDKLSVAFPNDFKKRKMSQTVTTKDKEFVCNRKIKRLDEKTMKYEEIICVEEFLTKRQLNKHIAAHKKNKELA